MRQKLYSEFIGTFILVFSGTGAMVTNEVTQGAVGNLGIAMTFGLIVIALIYSLGSISGCHINPAVTIALTLQKKISVKEAIPYIIVQFAGAIMASIVLRLIFPNSDTLGETLPSGSALQSFVLEFVLTFILMLTIIYSTKGENKAFAGLAIGGVVGLEACFAGPICGASMNPARSLAPALINLNFEHLWVYMVATILGALVAVLLDQFFIKDPIT